MIGATPRLPYQAKFVWLSRSNSYYGWVSSLKECKSMGAKVLFDDAEHVPSAHRQLSAQMKRGHSLDRSTVRTEVRGVVVDMYPTRGRR